MPKDDINSRFNQAENNLNTISNSAENDLNSRSQSFTPLRQPQPPVYFHTGGEPGAKERVEGGVGEEGEDDHF